MDTQQQRDLLLLLKTLADENRLTMVGLMSQREHTVTEMAAHLGLAEATVSHHVGKLHSAGLLNMRMAGTHRYYQVDAKRLARFKAYASDIETLPDPAQETAAHDTSWIDTLDWPAADKKVLREYIVQGNKLKQFPTKFKKWLVVLRWLASKFEVGVRYKERQVNAMLGEAHEDYARIRRDLVELGFMRRERGGGDYWLVPEDEAQIVNPYDG